MRRLNDLVYVHYNSKLKENQREKGGDPIFTKEFQGHARGCFVDVLPGEEKIFAGTGLTWGLVSLASGADYNKGEA